MNIGGNFPAAGSNERGQNKKSTPADKDDDNGAND